MWLFGKKAKFVKKTEKVDPTPASETIHFERPLSLEERVRRAIRAEFDSRQRPQPRDPADFDFEDPPEFVSPHELVVDEVSGLEVLPAEKRALDEERKRFDGYVTEARKRKKPVSQPASRKSENDQKAAAGAGETDLHSTVT